MKKLILLVFVFLFSFSSYSQMRRQRDLRRTPQTPPSETEKQKQKEKMEERKQEYIANFLTTLEADDFQKEIIKQYINSFFDEKIKVLKTPYEHSIERQEALKNLENNHFKELEELISEDDMKKIKVMISGDFDENEVIKKKKKKRKKKKKS